MSEKSQKDTEFKFRLSAKDQEKVVRFLSVIAITLVSILANRGIVDLSRHTARQEALEVAAAIWQDGSEGESYQHNLEKLNNLHENVDPPYVFLTIQSSKEERDKICQGDIIDIQPTQSGSSILLTTARHCVPHEEIRNLHVSINDFNGVINHDSPHIPWDGHASNIRQIIQWGIDAAAVIIDTPYTPQELEEAGFAAMEEQTFLLEPSSNDQAQAIGFILHDENNYDTPIGIDTTLEELTEEVSTADIDAFFGMSGMGIWDPSNGAYRGLVMKTAPPPFDIDFLATITATERQKVLDAWHEYLTNNAPPLSIQK